MALSAIATWLIPGAALGGLTLAGMAVAMYGVVLIARRMEGGEERAATCCARTAGGAPPPS